MTRPRGVVRPAIQAVLAALTVALAAAGAVGRRFDHRQRRPDDLVIVRCPRCRADCVRRPLP